jgi:hypothetical protein
MGRHMGATFETQRWGASFSHHGGARLKKVLRLRLDWRKEAAFRPFQTSTLGAWEADPLGHDPYRGKVTQGARFIYHVIFHHKIPGHIKINQHYLSR